MERKVACFECGLGWALVALWQAAQIIPPFHRYWYSVVPVPAAIAVVINIGGLALAVYLSVWGFWGMRETKDDKILMRAKIRAILES